MKSIANLHGLENYVLSVMEEWRVPGLALAILLKEEVLHARGYGLRNITSRTPVTADTRFAIASMTKAFTAMAVALLVDEGELEWDKPVQRYFPNLRLKDDYISKHITLRDMLSHRSGLPAHDLAWYNTHFTRQELVDLVRYHEFSAGFREKWQYNNLMYLIVGYLIGIVASTSWEEYVQTRIFNKLGMVATTFSAASMSQSDNYALPYRFRYGKTGKKDKLEEIRFFDNPMMGPSLSLHASLSDLIEWLKVHLNNGRYSDSQFVSPASLAQMHQPQMVMAVTGIRAKLFTGSLQAYGMGWVIQSYGDYTIIEHNGNIDGFRTKIAFNPQQKMGVIVLTNVETSPIRDILCYDIMDRLLGIRDQGWNAKFKALSSSYEQGGNRDVKTSNTQSNTNTKPSRPLSEYAATYVADGYAPFKVKLENNQLFGWIGGYWWPLKHYRHDIFELELNPIKMHLRLTFNVDPRYTVNALSLNIEPTVPEVSFKRQTQKLAVSVSGADGVAQRPQSE